ncbi:hypothetical protein KR779_02770, partial [Staphylococcus aureus]|nr:hypothetical protein [Staphylococcus aureus]
LMASISSFISFIFSSFILSNSKVSLHIGALVSFSLGLVTLNYRGNCAFCVLKKAGSFTFPP